MGFCYSTPLRKTGTGGTVNPLTRVSTSLPRYFDVAEATKKGGDEKDDKESEISPSSSAIPDNTRPYFSFTSFMIQNESPQIYEWLFIQDLGKGSMSQVYLVKNTETDHYCAAKVYNKSVLQRQTVGNEDPPMECLNKDIEIMNMCKHPNILFVNEMIDDPPSNSMIVIIPYAKYGSLETLINSHLLPMSNIIICCYQIADAMKYLHSKGICHRDIKPDIILSFSDNHFCISDFSLATIIDDEKKIFNDVRGTNTFLSPEEASGEGFSLKPADVWAFGVTFYWAFYNQCPFGLASCGKKAQGSSILSVSKCLKEEFLVFPSEPILPFPIKEMLSKMLSKDPILRPTFEEIVSYDFFQEARMLQRDEIIPSFESTYLVEMSNTQGEQ